MFQGLGESLDEAHAGPFMAISRVVVVEAFLCTSHLSEVDWFFWTGPIVNL